ncbi:MAG: type IV secretion system DNA-binding domain-containing protein [Patescibacteria group bacterium]
MEINKNEINFFGATSFRNQERRFGIKLDDRRRHMYIIGKTGMGKTTLLENMIIQDIKNGHGLAFIDPHGDSAEKILNYVPARRINDVIYFNPSDIDNPVAFNILELRDKRQRHMVASGLVGIFKKIWADSWGPRLEYLLRNAILALLDNEGTTLLGVMRILVDKAYRKKIVSNVDDPVVKSFWVDEFSRYPDKFAQEAIAPIQNKIGQFLSNYLIRNIVGQVKSSFDIRKVMDEGKVLIMNLSKGRIGEDTSQLLGAMMITQIQLSAMSRVDIPEETRKDFFLYVDEFQNFATESFTNILSEARKYRLNLTIAHQYVEQLIDEVKAAVFGNVGTMIVFRVGAADAEGLAKEFAPRFTEEDLVNLTKFEIYLKLMIDGVASEPFSAKTLPPLFEPEESDVSEKIIKVSRERYGRDRNEVEDKIRRWSVGDEGAGDNSLSEIDNGEEPKKIRMGEIEFQGKIVKAEIADRPTPERNLPWLCSNCGKITYLSFDPNPNKPVYCKNCLKELSKPRKFGEPSAGGTSSNPSNPGATNQNKKVNIPSGETKSVQAPTFTPKKSFGEGAGGAYRREHRNDRPRQDYRPAAAANENHPAKPASAAGGSGSTKISFDDII